MRIPFRGGGILVPGLLGVALGLAACDGRKVTAWTTGVQVSTTAEAPVAGDGLEWCVVEEGGQAACFDETNPDVVERHGGGAVAVAVGCSVACAVREDRSVDCWKLPRFIPSFDDGQATPPAGLGAAESVHVTCSRACAVLRDGSISCWGRTGVQPAGLGPVHGLALQDDGACAVRDPDASLACWGRDGAFEAWGPGKGVPVLSVTTGGARYCGMRADRTAWCDSPAAGGSSVLTDLGTMVDVRAAWNVVCGVDEDGLLGCDGYWSLRERVTGARFLGASLFGVCAVAGDGRLRCWKHDWW